MGALLEELFEYMYNILLEILKEFTMDLIKDCTPDLSFLHKQIPILNDMDIFFVSLGAALSVIVFASLLTLNMLKESPDKPLNLIMGFFASVFWIGLGKKLLDLILSASNDIFEGFKTLINSKTYNYLDDLYAGTSILDTIWLIIILIWLIKGFFALVIEAIERYALLGLFYHFSPLVAFSLISSDSRDKTFWTFIKMFISQIFLLFMNVFFMESAIVILSDIQGTGIKSYLFPAILCWAWLKIGTEVDRHINMTGITTAQAGRMMFENIVSPIKGLASATGTAGTLAFSASKKAVSGTGKTLSTIGGGIAQKAHGKNIGDMSAHNILKGKKDGTVTGAKAATGIASFFPNMNGKNISDGQVTKNGAVATVSNADGTSTDMKFSKTKTPGSTPVTDYKGNLWYATTTSSNGPAFGYGAKEGDSATLASRFSNNDIASFGFSPTDRLTNNGDGSLSITDSNGNTVGAMLNPKEYTGSLEGAKKVTDSDGNTWATYKHGSADSDLSNSGVMDCINNSYGEGQTNPVTSVDTAGFGTTGCICATRQDGSKETITADNAPQYFGGNSLADVATHARDYSAYSEATGKTPTSWDNSSYSSTGYYTVRNTDGSSMRVYSSAMWQPTHGSNHFTANDGSQYFTEEGTKKLNRNEDGTTKQQVVYKAKPRRKRK